jgi:predicted Zn-dependent protease
MGCKPSSIAFAAAVLLALAPAAAAPGSPVLALVERARASYRAGDHVAAVALAHQGLTLDPGEPKALALNAQLVRDAQGPVAALPLLERALGAEPRAIALLSEYGATLAAAGRNRDMLRVVRRIVELDPGNGRAYFLQAVLAARAGQDDLARRLLWRVRGDDDPEPAAMALDGVLELRSGSAAEAVDRFDALVRRQPDNLLAQRLLGRALLANGEPNEAAARLAPLAERGDAEPYLLTLTARAYEELGRRDVAARYLDRAARPLPRGAWAMPVNDPAASGDAGAVAALRLALAAGKLSEARSQAAMLTSRYPGSADVARLHGDVLLLAGETAQALESYRRAAAVRTDAALVERMVAALRALGRGDEARALLAGRLAASPLERSSAVLLAQLDAEQGRWADAAALLGYAARTGSDPRVLAQLAQARLALGQDATGAAWQAHRLQRGNAGVAWVLARTLQVAGQRPREAEALLAKAQQLAAPPLLASR